MRSSGMVPDAARSRPRPLTGRSRVPSGPALLLALVAVAVPLSASGQQDVVEEADAGSARSPVAAAVVELYVPLLGYHYAGDWKRGIPPAVLWTAGVAGLAYASKCVPGDRREGCSRTREAAGELGWAAAAISRLWGAVGAFRTAREHNRNRPDSGRFDVRAGSGGGLDVGVRLWFGGGRPGL